MQARHKGATQHVAAAKAGMSERTARRYERAGKLPSELKRPRTWRTRPNPFEEDWPWVAQQLERDPALQVATLFALLCAQQPGKYAPTQVPEKEVYFAQIHHPGERMQSDFTHMEAFQVTIAGIPFPHLLYHSVLT